MKRIGTLLSALFVAATVPMALSGQTTAAALFQEGLMLERAEGKLRDAVVRYERVVAEFPGDRQTAAQALLRLGAAYDKLRKGGSTEAYERILRDYADRGEVAAEARRRLAARRPTGMTSRRVLSGHGADPYGTISPDGRYLSFMDPDTRDLAVRDLKSGDTRRLTKKPTGSTEFAEYSIFSRDSRRLAYGWRKENGNYDIRIISVDGGESRLLYSNHETGWMMPYDWSPDGRQILAILPRADRTRQLIFISTTNGSVRVLKTLTWNMGVPSAAFSPDGRFIAYDRRGAETEQHTDVFLIAADGSREVPLVDGPSNESFLAWFPDGQSVLFSSDRTGAVGAWAITVGREGPEGEPRLLKPDFGRQIHSKGFTSDGHFYYFQRVGVPDVSVAEIDPAAGRVTRAPAPLKGRPAEGRTFASWSHDGERILYAIGGFAKPLLGVYDTRSHIVRTIPVQMNYMGPVPTWTPDGAVLVTGLDQRARAGIYRVNLDTGAVEPLAHLVANGAGGARLSPDAKWVFYSHDVEESKPKRRLSARNVLTGETREVIQGVSGSFSLSPDGRWLALRAPTGATDSIQIVSVTGGTPRTILTFRPEEGRGFDWTPDGSALMVVRGEGNSEVWRVPVDGSTAEKLALRLPGMQTLSVSPDGRRLALVAVQQTKEVWVVENLVAAQGRR